MVKALASRVLITPQDTEIAVEYYREMEDLLFAPEVLKLEACNQHMNCNRLQHSINVSYYSFLICRRLKLNARAAARGGLLHDLFYYDWRESGVGKKHISMHPQIALANAQALTDLTDMEQDIIVKHMWPMYGIPKYRESYIVSMTDKVCAAMEAAVGLHALVFKDGMRFY